MQVFLRASCVVLVLGASAARAEIGDGIAPRQERVPSMSNIKATAKGVDLLHDRDGLQSRHQGGEV